ncbi:MAG: dihydropteroate synthase [Isosphaeraceae bacterium]|nr:dihydropteroate synthase [Isosphaeraceae bacterium]
MTLASDRREPTKPMPHWTARRLTLLAPESPPTRPLVMGIVNTTPDSFSDGGLALEPDDALAHARRLVAQGADLLDIGGESTRPDAPVVALDEELRRVLPVVERLLALPDAPPISIDTSKPEVARRALDLGASIINDVTALADPDMRRVVADSGAGVVLMHMRGDPRTMQLAPRYDDVAAEVVDFLARRIELCIADGIPRERIAVDPGIGFGKTQEHNLTLLREIPRFRELGCAILIGVSRKGFLGIITGRPRHERAVASAVCSLHAATLGASVLRVHDVAPLVDALAVWSALEGPFPIETSPRRPAQGHAR